MLHPRVAVVRRPCGAVQLGWDPEHALVLDPPGIAADAVAQFMRLLDGMHSQPQVVWQASQTGLPADAALQLLAAVDAAGLLLHPREHTASVRAVHIHGRGPLSDALAAGVRHLGLHPTRTRDGTVVHPAQSDLVILADTLIPEPGLVVDLVLRRIPHYVVRIRDGRGIVGPLVLPGATSCLRCADLTRTDFDSDWPHIAAQLLGKVGHGSPATVAATAALALRDLERIVEVTAQRPPWTIDTTVELDPDSYRVHHRRWRPHPACGCGALSRTHNRPAPQPSEVAP